MERGIILCANCQRTRKQGTCPKCGKDPVYVRIQWKGEIYRFWKRKDGKSFPLIDAINLLVEINQKIKNHTFKPVEYTWEYINDCKFQNAFARWIQKKQKLEQNNELSPETLRCYKSYNKNYFNIFKNVDVRDIGLLELEDLYDGFPGTLSSKYKKNIMKCLETFLNWGVKRRIIETLPEFPEIKVRDARVMVPISYEEQIESIMNMPEKHRDIFFFMRETGIRISEACAILVSDIDFQKKRALIQWNLSGSKLQHTTKGNKKEWIALSDFALEIVTRNIKKIGSSFIFINPITNRRYSTEFLRKLWKRESNSPAMLKEAMRHSTLSDWANNGANAFQIKEQARHSDIRTSDNYVKNAKERLYDMVNRRKVIPFKKEESKSG